MTRPGLLVAGGLTLALPFLYANPSFGAAVLAWPWAAVSGGPLAVAMDLALWAAVGALAVAAGLRGGRMLPRLLALGVAALLARCYQEDFLFRAMRVSPSWMVGAVLLGAGGLLLAAGRGGRAPRAFALAGALGCLAILAGLFPTPDSWLPRSLSRDLASVAEGFRSGDPGARSAAWATFFSRCAPVLLEVAAAAFGLVAAALPAGRASAPRRALGAAAFGFLCLAWLVAAAHVLFVRRADLGGEAGLRFVASVVCEAGLRGGFALWLLGALALRALAADGAPSPGATLPGPALPGPGGTWGAGRWAHAAAALLLVLALFGAANPARGVEVEAWPWTALAGAGAGAPWSPALARVAFLVAAAIAAIVPCFLAPGPRRGTLAAALGWGPLAGLTVTAVHGQVVTHRLFFVDAALPVVVAGAAAGAIAGGAGSLRARSVATACGLVLAVFLLWPHGPGAPVDAGPGGPRGASGPVLFESVKAVADLPDTAEARRLAATPPLTTTWTVALLAVLCVLSAAGMRRWLALAATAAATFLALYPTGYHVADAILAGRSSDALAAATVALLSFQGPWAFLAFAAAADLVRPRHVPRDQGPDSSPTKPCDK